MKFNLNKILGLFGMLLIFCVAPFTVFGEETIKINTNSDIDNNIQNNFCSKIDSINERLSSQIKTAEEKQLLYQSTRLINIEKLKSEIDGNRAVARAEADGEREDNWEKMESKAKTDEQKMAVSLYKETIQSAIQLRRESVDKAIQVYRDGLFNTVTNHSLFVNNAIDDFKTLTEESLNTAKSDCENHISDIIANENFTIKIDAAKEALKVAKNEVETNPGITELKKNRDDAINLAETTFTSAIEDAHKTLVEALTK